MLVFSSSAVTIARWNEMGWGLEEEIYPAPALTTTDKALLHYDKNITYYIRGYDAINLVCLV